MIRTLLSVAVASFLGVALSVSQVDARRGGGGGHHGGGHHGGHHHHAGGHYHHGGHHHAGHGHWRNGVWIATGAAVYGYGGGCAYAYQQWQATGSRYWRDRYYACGGY
jgi:hypothetical protein